MQVSEIPELQRATYDNQDVAFALDLYDFPNWRKNIERSGFNLPRIDENPARPRFRIGHIYEFALIQEFAKYMPRDHAVAAVGEFLSDMMDRAVNRFNELDNETRLAIHYDRTADRYREQSAIPSKSGNGWFVDFPWLAFDAEVLDRSDARKSAPLMWIIPSEGIWRHARSSTLGAAVDVVGECSRLTEAYRRVCIDTDRVEPVKSVIIINVTDILAEVDRRLVIRLHARKLKGE